MATLHHPLSRNSIKLFEQHIFGRHPNIQGTQLQNKEASRMHAVINWDGETWTLKDTSSNGTFLNGKRLIRNNTARLDQGDQLQFGSLQADTWELSDTSAPKPVLIPLRGDLPLYELSGIIALPSEHDAIISIYYAFEGHWLCESPAGTVRLRSGDIVGTEDKQWRFFDVQVSSETHSLQKSPVPPASVQFNFRVSQNEEHVFLKLTIDHQEYNLGERSHHYLLLLLAREKIKSTRAGITNSEQGWLEKKQLAKMLGMQELHINTQIHRFRKQLDTTLPTHVLHQVIERRSGELRFAYDKIAIDGGLDPQNM